MHLAAAQVGDGPGAAALLQDTVDRERYHPDAVVRVAVEAAVVRPATRVVRLQVLPRRLCGKRCRGSV